MYCSTVILNRFSFQCNSNQFTCQSGACIDITQRCNKVVDCEDFSHENNLMSVSWFVSQSGSKTKLFLVSFFLVPLLSLMCFCLFLLLYILQLSVKNIVFVTRNFCSSLHLLEENISRKINT